MADDGPSQTVAVAARFSQGDEAAFEALFRRWHPAVFRWALRIVRDRGAAEEVTADAFWRAYRARARFDPSKDFGAWIRRIATHAALDQLKREQRERSRRAPMLVDVAAGDAAPADDLGADTAAAMRRLSPKLRIVALLALIEDEPYDVIADALGISVAAVKVRVFRAVRQLRRDLAHLRKSG
ncbi:MAG: RNA polymerase sigma factor [Vicinamibacterales bacterium]